MPRAVDRRQIAADYDPTRSGTEFHIANLSKDLLEERARAVLGFSDPRDYVIRH